MKNTDLERVRVEQNVLELVNACRGRVLNVVEAQMGSSENWRIVRGQLLNIFGEKGLSGEVQRAFNGAFARESV